MLSNYIEWCNENEGRSYPLAEDSSQRSTDGQLLPTNIIADLGVLVPPQYTDIYVSSVRVTPTLYSVCLVSSSGPLLTCVAVRPAYTPYQAVPMDPQVDDVTGWIVFGNHRTNIAKQYTFASAADSGLAARAVRIVDRLPVRRMLKYGGTTAQYVDQLVKLIGGNALSIYQDPDNASNIIFELDAATCSDFLGPCEVYPDAGGCALTPIRDISGVSADETGAITLRFTG
jgi:hypothetical protein